MKSVIQTSRIIYSPAGSVSATVSKVTLQGPAKAEVVFSVKFSLFTLKDRVGYAVLQGGKWKVASGTLCALLTIYQGSVPLACKS